MSTVDAAPPDVNSEVKAKGKDVHWYRKDLDTINETVRLLLEKYSGIAPDEVIPHVLKMRDRAWDIYPYPCIGRFTFLDLSISISPAYPEVLKRLIKSKHTLLDLGCCFAQDIRKLVSDGAPSENLYGAELRKDFIDLGYDLFRDRETLKAKFVIGDIFDNGIGSWFRDLEGKINIVHAASIFHLFNWEEQVRMAERVVGLLKPEKGSMLLGRQRGNLKPGEYEHRTNQGGTMFRHDEESWKKMWTQVGESTGTSWDVNVKLLRGDDDLERMQVPKNGSFGNRVDSGDGSLRFEVVRL